VPPYETLPVSWALFVQWVRENPARAQEVGTRFIQRVLATPGLAKELEDLISGAEATRAAGAKAAPARKSRTKREKAVFDPIEVAGLGESVLRDRLAPLTLIQLRDVISEYAIDPSHVVSRKRTLPPIIDFIVDVSLARARKGEGFKV
jgi:hypothetical protein